MGLILINGYKGKRVMAQTNRLSLLNDSSTLLILSFNSFICFVVSAFSSSLSLRRIPSK